MHIEWTVPEGHREVMLRTCIRGSCGLSASLWRRIKWNGRVLVNGEPVHNARLFVRGGDRIRCEWSEASDIVPADLPLSVVYEDPWLLVVDKPAGMIIHPTHQGSYDTLVNAVAGYFKKNGTDAGIHPLYRLDRNTTGLVVVAKSAHIQYEMTRSHDQITRRYLAFSSGHLEEPRGIVDAPIGRKEGSIIEWTVRADGKPARTAYEVLRRGVDFDVLRLRLYTGRTHQIRVHMAHLGHSLLGDDLYGGSQARIERQALHAADVALIHPATGKLMQWTSPLPEDMQNLLLC